MTFNEFCKTAKDVRLQEVNGYGDDLSSDSPVRGLCYLGCLCIEDSRTWPFPPEVDEFRPRWYLVLGNAEFGNDDLTRMERMLYEFAIGAGIITSDA